MKQSIFSPIVFIKSRLDVKLIIAVTLLLSAISFIITSYFIIQLKNARQEELRARANVLAHDLARYSMYPIMVKNHTVLEKHINAIINNRQKANATLFFCPAKPSAIRLKLRLLFLRLRFIFFSFL